MDKKALVEERAKLWTENNALLDANPGGLSGEQQAEFDKRELRMKEIRGTLDRVELHEAEERALGESRGRRTDSVIADSAPTPEMQQLAFRGWCLGRHATEEMRNAAAVCGVRMDLPHIDVAPRIVERNGKRVQEFVAVRTNPNGDIESRALSIGTTTAGGNSVPNEVMRAYYEVQKWYGRVREMAMVVQTETGATLPWPTVNDTANTGRVLGEATAATTTTDPSFGVVNLGAFKFSSDAVLISWELLQDSFIDLATFMGTMLGRRIGRIQNTKFTVGAGTTEPKGVITGATVGKTAAATNAFTFDEVIDLVHSLDPAYRGLPDTGFMIHDTIAAYVRKMKDGTGRYVWEPGLQLGQPDRLLGFAASINNDMDSALTTGKKLLAFGNLKLGFLVRDAGAVRIVRSDEKYVLEHQVMFEASQRADSNVIDTTAIKVLALA